MTDSRAWVHQAIQRIEADFQRSADTHLLPLPLPGFPGIMLYLKDESSHPTGSLKHRLARSLFLHALANGWLYKGCSVVESSSGSTAVSEAYFARLLELPFIAVMPRGTSPQKIAAIEFQGGRCHLVDDAAAMHPESERLARELGGHFMDQFTFAERATDWRANNNIAESIYTQLAQEPHPCPSWIVAGAGTGGTLATIGRYARYRRHATRVCGVDAEHSVFFAAYAASTTGTATGALTHHRGSRIEGIGRPRVEASFIPTVLDAMVKVPDRWSLAAAHALSQRMARRVGGSTGTNLIAALCCANAMRSQGVEGSIVTLICDGGDRYGHSYFDNEWLCANDLECATQTQQVQRWIEAAELPVGLPEALLTAGALAPTA